ncbi:TonB-dependent receptor [Sphingomonas sp. R647]|uniref:TonB-dependent receptor plug domain-containing protein n=1 Tax=Sphingomonas sp. R647 TaxID=2875233 RepID=UPI001CD400F9|nr:TonB-dependent receptor [Sphingomonas sp. R647]MCA1196496.1 TonB-dependent receptor [Sphingomonas sp. R647]
MKTLKFALVCASTMLIAPDALARQADAQTYDIAETDLGRALNQVAARSGRQILVADDLVQGLRARRLKGRYAPEAALAALLAGTGLRAVVVGDTLVIRRADAPDQDMAGEEVLVTGTRIRGHGPVGSAVVTIDRAAIDQAGFSTTQQIVQSIPQNFAGGANENTAGLLTAAGNGNAGRGSSVNLRGLGPTSTLLLVNGDRPPLGGFGGTFADLSVIPASVIERVEIVADGSSAIYGSDAVAGVVNVITRRDFDGAESNFRIGTADGDAQEYQLSQLLGTRWASGHAVVAYEFYQRDALAAADRAYATDDLRRFGGPDRRGPYAVPGTIHAGGTSFAIPAGQNGVGLTAAQLTAGTVNLGDRWLGADLLPQQRRHSVFAAISQNVGDTLRIYANGLATWRSFTSAVQPSGDTRRTVPVTNPFYVDPIGTNQPIGVNYSFVRDLGPERDAGQVNAYGLTGGAEARLGPWRVDAHATWGRQDERYAILNRVNSARLALALADPDPATAYNLLGDGATTNRATIESVRGYSRRSFYGMSWSATLRADGPLFTLPAGAVRLAVGAEYRRDRNRDGETISYTATLDPRVTAPTPLPDARIVKAAYAELLIPIFGEGARLPGFRRLDLSAAIRTEDYSDFGSTRNPKIGLVWESLPGVRIRSSYGTSFRAPLFSEMRQDPSSIGYFAFPVADPQSPTGTSNLLVIRGNDPNLRPERATSWTLGVDLTPRFVSGFRFSATYFDVDYRDRIASPAPNLANFLVNRNIYDPILTPNPTPARIAEVYASPYYLDLFGIPQTATFVAEADARLQNLSVVRQSGLDLDIGYAFGIAGGQAEIGAVATHIFHIRQALTATAAAIDVVDTIGNPVDLRVRGRASFEKSGFGAALFVNHVDGYWNRTTAVPQRVASWTTFDLNLSYRFSETSGALAGVRVALNASNLFDRDPPYVTYTVGSYTSGFDAENASPLGRMIALQVTRTW